MQVSAEIRWFWPKEPSGLKAWFCNAEGDLSSAGGGKARGDEYLRDDHQVELGLKSRGGKKGIEVKGLVAIVWGGLAVGPFRGPIEIWAKWTSETLELQPTSTVSTTKLRWLRKFDTAVSIPKEIQLDADEKRLEDKDLPLPALGCNVELTEVTLASKVWWTLGFEAFGTIHTIENDLRAVATVLAARRPPELGEGLLASYPAWFEYLAKKK